MTADDRQKISVQQRRDMKKRNWVLINILLSLSTILLPEMASAQDPDYKREVYGHVGYGKLLDDETNLGNGLAVGGGFGYRITRRLGVTLEVSRNGHRREESYIKIEGSALLIGGGLQYHFRAESNAQPYFRVGLSFAHYNGTFTYPPSPSFPGIPQRPGFEESGTQNFVGPEVGVGIKIFVNKKISIRPEARIAIHSGFHKYDPPRDILEPALWAPRFNIGIGYHW
jgi:Outer membrane protein beta-barrel domain